MTDPPAAATCASASVVSRESVRIALTVAALNNLETFWIECEHCQEKVLAAVFSPVRGVVSIECEHCEEKVLDTVIFPAK
jgi:DNA-directed RNA polymerase subunit RPC12/RpoP